MVRSNRANYDRLLFAVPVLAALLQNSASYAGRGSTGGSIYTSTDLGTVAASIQINAQIDTSTGSTYTYNQLLFLGSSLNAVVTDSNGNQTTVAEILANDLGPANNGTLSYNFPVPGGSSGTFVQTSTTPGPSFSSQSDPPQTFQATSVSGSTYPSNQIGASDSVNPLNPADTYVTILSLPPADVINNGTVSSVSLNLPAEESLGTQVSYISLGGATDEIVYNQLYGEVTGTGYAVTGNVNVAGSTVTTLTWDPGRSSSSGTDGAGDWTNSTSTTDWWDGTSGHAATYWTDGDTAIIGSGSAGNTITLTSPITAGGITFNPVTSPYTIAPGGSGDSLTVNGIIILNNDATISAPLAGASGLSVSGAHTLTLSGDNSGLNAPITVENGAIVGLDSSNPAADGNLGSGTVMLQQGELEYTGTAAIVIVGNNLSATGAGNAIDAGGEQLTLTGNLSGAGTLELTDGNVVLAPSTAGGNTGNGGFTGTLDINGGPTGLATLVHLNSQNAVPRGGITLENGAGLTNNSHGPLTFNNALTVKNGGGFFDTGAQINIFANAIGGDGLLTIEGNGRAELYGFSGSFTGGVDIVNSVSADPTTAVFYNPGSLGNGTVTIGPGGGELAAGATAVPLANNIVLSDPLTGGGPDIYSTGSPANSDTLSGVISDANGVRGGLEVTGGGEIILSGANTYSGGTAIEDATTVIVANSGTPGSAEPLGLGDVSLAASRLETINALAVSNPSGIQINIGGNYTPDAASILVLTISGTPISGNYDAVRLNGGNATLNGLLLIQFNQGFVPTVGDKYTVVSTTGAGAVTGQFSGVFATNEPVRFLQDTSSGNSDVIEILPFLDPQTAEMASIMGYIAIQNNVFQGETVFGRIADRFAGAAGWNTSGLAVLNTPNADPFTVSLNSAMQSVGRVAGLHAAGLAGIGAREDPLGASGTLDALQGGAPAANPQASQDVLSGFISGDVVAADVPNTAEVVHYTTGGVIGGVDYNLARHLVIGAQFAFGFTGAKLDSADSTLRDNSYSPGLYFGLRQRHFYLDTLAGYTYNRYALHRNVAGAPATATGRPYGQQFNGDALAGYNFHPARGVKLGPAAGLDYTHLNVSGYVESGAGASDLNVAPVSVDSLRSLLGGCFNYTWHMSPTEPGVNLGLNAFWQHEYFDGSRGIIASFVASPGSASFAIDTPAPDRDAALLGADISGSLAPGVTVFLDYEAQLGHPRQLAQSALAGLAIALK